MSEFEVRKNNLQRIEMILTTACNFRCLFCSSAEKINKNPIQELDPELFVKIIDEIQHPTAVNLIGAEPLLYFHNKQYLYDYIFSNSNIVPEFLSNGYLVDQHNSLLKCFDEHERWQMRFSVDGIGETYEKLRVNSDWEKVLSNIELVSRLKNGSHNFLGINYIVMKDTLYELRQALDIFEEIGVDYISISYLFYSPWAEKLHGFDFKSQYLSQDEIKTELSNCVSYLEQNEYDIILQSQPIDGISFSYNGFIPMSLSDLSAKSCRKPSYLVCGLPYDYMMIRYDGYVYPCCRGYNLIMGNCYQDNIYDIFMNHNYKKLRNDIVEKNEIPEYCVCTSPKLVFNNSALTNTTYSNEKVNQQDEYLKEYSLIKKESVDDAINFLESKESLSFDLRMINVWNELASVYLYRKEDYKKSRFYIKKILNIKSDHSSALIKLANIEVFEGNYDVAINMLEGLDFNDNILSIFWLGYAYEKSERYDLAQEKYMLFIQVCHHNNQMLDSWGYNHSNNFIQSRKENFEQYIKSILSKSLKLTQEKIRNSDNLNVVFFGSCWFNGLRSFHGSFVEKLKNEYPNVNVQSKVYALGSAVASSCFFRLEKEVIEKNPDLIFIHCFFTHVGMDQSNDNNYTNEVNFVESMVRKIIKKIPNVSIVLIPHFSFRFNVYEYPKELMDHYNVCLLPTFDFINQLSINNGCSMRDDVYDDHSHLSEFGAKAFGAYFFELFQQVMEEEKCTYPKLPNKNIFPNVFDDIVLIDGEAIKSSCNWQHELKNLPKAPALGIRPLFTSTNTNGVLEITVKGNNFVFWFGINSMCIVYIEIDEKIYKRQIRIYDMQESLCKKGILFAFDTIFISCDGDENKKRNIKIYMPENQPVKDYKLEFWGIGVCKKDNEN